MNPWLLLIREIPLRYVFCAVVLAVMSTLAAYYRSLAESWHAQYDSQVAQSAAWKASHEKDVSDAHHARDLEIEALRNARPVAGPVRLCAPPALVHAAAATGPASSPAAWPVQPVPAGDPRGGTAEAGPDIGPMLESLGRRADAVSADLREQQAVR